MDDEQEIPKTRIRSFTRNQMSITSLGTGPSYTVYPGLPSASHGPLVLAPIWLITPRPSTGPFL
jgi:hypothetical protein